MSTNSNILSEIPTFGSRELLDLHQIIGSGGMGVVSLYEWKIDDLSQSIRKGQKAAVKKLECTSDIRGVKDEAKILWPRHTQCKYILRMYGLLDAAGVGIVLDFMKYGNIADFFSVVKEAIDLARIWPLKSRIAQQVCDGMAYLHSCGRPVLHCDLKATNVLLDDKLIVKICDFGLAKIKRLTTRAKSDEVSKTKEPLVNCPAGTVSHLAPELLRFGKRPTKKSDVYSFGILIWELLTDRKPYEGVSHPFIIINEVLAKKRPDLTVIPSGCPELLKRIMTEAWQQNPGGRPDFPDLRRRLRDIDTRGIEDSVACTRHIWEDQQTRPKELRSRTESQRYFCTQNYSEPRVQEQRLLNCPVTDPVSDEIFISDDSSDATESTKHSIEDASEPLLDVEPPPFNARPRVNPKTFCCQKVAIALLLALCLWGGTFFVGRYLSPSCAKGCCLNCFDPFDPGMQTTCNLSNDTTTAPPGSTCTFSCADGYILNGNVTNLACGSNGVWSGPLPYCRKIRQCPPLKLPANGGSMQCTTQYYEGSKCVFSCPSGYRLRLPNKFPDNFDITCKSNEVLNYQWSGEEPYCEKVVSCASPTSDPNVVLKCDPPDSSNTRQDLANAKDQTYSNGSVCTFSCPSETSLGSNETASICLDNGKWNTTAAVSCINAGCNSTPWKIAQTNTSIKELKDVAVYGFIHKLSIVLDSEKSQYFLGELINECSTIQFVCFDARKYRQMENFKETASTVLLRKVDIKRSDKYGLQVIINQHGDVVKSNHTVPTTAPGYRLTKLSDVLELSTKTSEEVNIRGWVISKDPLKMIEYQGKSLLLYISYLSDDTAEVPLRQWTKDRVPVNKTFELTNLVVKEFNGKKFLQMTSFSKIKM